MPYHFEPPKADALDCAISWTNAEGEDMTWLAGEELSVEERLIFLEAADLDEEDMTY